MASLKPIQTRHQRCRAAFEAVLLCEETRAIVALCAPQGGIGHDIAIHTAK
jgi:hypothetical protein